MFFIKQSPVIVSSACGTRRRSGNDAVRRQGSAYAAATLMATRLIVGVSARLTIMIFHRIVPEFDPLLAEEPDAVRFRAIVEVVAEQFQPLSLKEGLRRLSEGTLPPNAVCLTFDDGYSDNLTVAAPILKRFGVPATVFVASGFLDGRVMWNDRVIESVRRAQGDRMDLVDLGLGEHALGDVDERVGLLSVLIGKLKYLPAEQREEITQAMVTRYAPGMPSPMLSRAQVCELRDEGIEIGGHTVTHPILARTDNRHAFREISANKEDLEALIGDPLHFFAYPNGQPGRDFNRDHADMVRRVGYEAALTTRPGVSTPSTDRFWLPRFTPWDRTRLRFSLRLLLNMRNAV